MSGKTFAEKIFAADCGSIVFKKPDIVLSHDNTASIAATFAKMGGSTVADSDQLLIVLDHNAPPTNAKLANDYQKFVNLFPNKALKNFMMWAMEFVIRSCRIMLVLKCWL